MPNSPAPAQAPGPRRSGKKTLAGIVGISVAIALGISIPREESGRKVEASIDPQSHELKIRHISGKQYLRVYLDIVGVPTACDGLIRDEFGRPMRPGQTFTEAQCSAMLERALVAHADGVMKCSPGLAVSSDPAIERRREGPRFSAVDLGYNVGVANYCSSSSRRHFNAGNYRAGCDALLGWNKGTFSRPQPGTDCTKKKSGGYLCRIDGLAKRRQRAREVCLKGLSVTMR